MMHSIIKKLNNKKLDNLYFIIGIAIIIFTWICSSIVIDNEFVLPKLGLVLDKTIQLLGEWYTIKIILLTILKLVFVVLSCALIAYVLAIISYLSRAFKMILRPIMSLIRTLPIATVLVLLILYVGLKQTPIYICAFVVLPIIYEQVLISFESIDKTIVEETKMLSNTNLYIIMKVYFPITFPYFITSIFTVLGLGIKVLVMAEIFSIGNNTIGEQIQTARSLSDMTSIFAWTIILLLIVFVFEAIISIFKKRLI